jgi:O-antigen/teichoic acid export membrane protein
MTSSSRTTKVMALSLGTFLTQMVGMVSGIVLARLLTKEDLATYRQTMLAYQFAAPFLTLAMPSALYFFLPRRPGNERTVLFSNLVPLAVMGVVFSGCLLIGGARLLAWRFSNPGLEHTLRLLALYPLFALPMAALEACLVARNQIAKLTVFNVVSRFLLTAGLIGVCILWRRPEPLVLTQVVLAGIMVVPALILMSKACAAGNAKPEPALMWEMVRYSVPLGLAMTLGTMTLQLSSVIVSAICTPEDFAVYSVGAFELPLISVVTGSITTVILADMSRLCHQGRKDEALRLFQTTAVRSAAILFPAMIFFSVAAEPFIIGMFSQKYQASILPFRLYLLTLPIRIVTYGAALMALGMTRIVLLRSIFEFLINALLCVILVHRLGYIGGVIALLVTLYTWSSAYNLQAIARGFGVRFLQVLPIGVLMRIFGTAAIMVLPLWAILTFTHISPIASLALAAFVYWPATVFLLNRHHSLPISLIADRLINKARFFCSRPAQP